jgi:cold shock CspA family protein
MQTGIVISYHSKNGYGFIRPIGAVHVPDLFFHASSVVDRICLQPDDLVSFNTRPSKNKPGRFDAIDIILKRDEVSPTPAREAR